MLTYNCPISKHGFVNPNYHLKYFHASSSFLYLSVAKMSHIIIDSCLYERVTSFVPICKIMHST